MKRSVLGCWIILISLGTSGCAIFGGGDEHVFGSASLSDAAQQARPDTTRQRRKGHTEPLDVGWTQPPEVEAPTTTTSLGVSETPERPAGKTSSGSDRGGALLGLVAGGGGLGGASYDGYEMFGVSLGGYLTPRWRADVIGSFGGVNFAGQSVAGQAFRDEVELALDVTTRYYVSPPYTLMSVYPLFGLRFGTLFWNFAQPVVATEDGQTKSIRGDQINFFALYGGGGLSLLQIRHVHVGANLTAGVRLYSVSTKEGFSNDLLPDTGFFQGMIETSYKF